MSQKYVTQGAILTCNQGTAPGTLQVTSNFVIKSQNKPIATELDKAPFVNIPPFAICGILSKSSPVPCVPAPIMWTDTHPTTKCCGFKALLNKSTIQCAIGGKISITNTAQTAGTTGAKIGKEDSDQILDAVQVAFDVAGLIPGAGEIFDGINVVIYTFRGDYTNAALSAAAMIPIAGWAATGGKVGGKAVKILKSLNASADIIKSSKKTLSNSELVIKAGQKAYNKIPGKGPIVGTARHQYATKLLQRYQKIYGDKSMRFKVRSEDGKAILDVLDKKNKIIYDWKFGSKARMSNFQKNKYQIYFPNHQIIPIHIK